MSSQGARQARQDSVLHTPAPDGSPLEIPEDKVFYDQTDNDHGQQSREDGRDIQNVAIFENEPAKSTLPG